MLGAGKAMNRLLPALFHVLVTASVLLTSFFAGIPINAAAQAHEGMKEHAQTKSLSCQSQCSNTTSLLPTLLKKDEEERAADPSTIKSALKTISIFPFSVTKQCKAFVYILSQLRPPDIFALNCSYCL